MFEDDLQQIKKLMEKHRRTSRYVQAFAPIIYAATDISQANPHSIRN